GCWRNPQCCPSPPPATRSQSTSSSVAGAWFWDFDLVNTRWRIAVLLSAAIAISYLDRQTLPVAIGAIREDIPISNQVKAFLDSAFLITYGLMYLGGGRLMDIGGVVVLGSL